MAKKVKLSVHDIAVEDVQGRKWCAYVKTGATEKVVGVYSSTENMQNANINAALKKLRNKFKYTIQMVIE